MNSKKKPRRSRSNADLHATPQTQNRRFIVQLSALARGYKKPKDDLSDLKQFVFVVEAPAIEDVEDPLYAAIVEARKNDKNMISDVKSLNIDWIIDLESATGLVWECSTMTEMPLGTGQIMHHVGVHAWTTSEDSEDRTFVDFSEE